MIKYILLFATVVMSPSVLLASDKSALQDLLDAATGQASLLESSPRPFEMNVDFPAQFDTPIQGHLRLNWEAKTPWWSKGTVGPLEQANFKDAEKTSTMATTDFPPRKVRTWIARRHCAKDW